MQHTTHAGPLSWSLCCKHLVAGYNQPNSFRPEVVPRGTLCCCVLYSNLSGVCCEWIRKYHNIILNVFEMACVCTHGNSTVSIIVKGVEAEPPYLNTHTVENI